jgi:peroxiredoxin
MRKNIIAISFMVLFIFTLVWLIVIGTKPEVLPVGSQCPQITYKTINGYDTLKTNSQNKMLVIYFSKDCPHCEYELSILNENLKKLEEVMVYLLTTNESYLKSEEIQANKNLLLSSKVFYGIVNEENFNQSFGSLITPSLYFFNKKGVLTEKIKGETKFERILEELEKSGSPEYRVSGSK